MRILMLAILLLGGCAGGGRYLAGGEWRAVDVNGVPTSDKAPVTLRLDGAGAMSGGAGCNSYSGGYAVSPGERIAFDTISQTERACDPAAMEMERRYLALLAAAQRYSIYGDGSLSLIAGDGRAVRYRRRGGR